MKLKEALPGIPLVVLCLLGLWGSQAPANPIPVGPCCFPDGRCEVMPEDTCLAAGGIWIFGGECEPNPCPQPGPCCFADGSCVILPESDCAGQGVWLGPGTPCSPNPCPPCFLRCFGVCCLSDGSCAAITEGDCLTADGTWLDAPSCSPDPCATSHAPEPPIQISSWGRIKSLYR